MKTLGYLALLYCSIVWGTAYFIAKDALTGVHPVTMVGYRFFVSAALLFFVLIFLRVKNIFAPAKTAFLLALLLAPHYVGQTWGLGYTTAVNGGFISGLFVLFVPMFMKLFFNKPITFWQWFSCSIAVGGLWVLTGGIKGLMLGDAIMFFVAPLYSAFLVLTDKHINRNVNMLSFAFNLFLFCGLIAFVFCALLGYSFKITGTKTIISVSYITVFATFGTYISQLWAQKRIDPVRAGLIISLCPVFSAVFAWTYGKEPFKLSALAGGLVILSAVFINEFGDIAMSKIRGTR